MVSSFKMNYPFLKKESEKSTFGAILKKSTFEKSLNPIQVCFRLFLHSNSLCHLYIASSNITLSLNHVLYTGLILLNPMPDAKNYF